MGELIDYYIILSTVEFDNDPLKFGRIKCQIPGVIHTSTTEEEAMPWVRPFKMYGYQTFSRPIVGQKVWVLVSKTNYNEFWWFPFHETQDFVQSYLEKNYDNQPDVFNYRSCGCGDAMFTFDEENGYLMQIGPDSINLKTNREMKIKVNSCRLMVEGDLVYAGHGDSHGSYEPCVMGNKCKEMRSQLAAAFTKLATAAKGSPYTSHLSDGFEDARDTVKAEILATNTFIN